MHYISHFAALFSHYSHLLPDITRKIDEKAQASLVCHEKHPLEHVFSDTILCVCLLLYYLQRCVDSIAFCFSFSLVVAQSRRASGRNASKQSAKPGTGRDKDCGVRATSVRAGWIGIRAHEHLRQRQLQKLRVQWQTLLVCLARKDRSAFGERTKRVEKRAVVPSRLTAKTFARNSTATATRIVFNPTQRISQKVLRSLDESRASWHAETFALPDRENLSRLQD